jgi:hypothetical protein
MAESDLIIYLPEESEARVSDLVSLSFSEGNKRLQGFTNN